jgi:hypothetical protein
MKEHGRAFQCAPCQQIIVFFTVSDASPYLAVKAQRPMPARPNMEAGH